MTTYITTAIPYVNAQPHLGFAYELVLADVLARHRRRRGQTVRFTTGTDDHSLKNVAAAAREGLTVRALVDRNAAAFQALGPLLGVAPDAFVGTSRDERHRPTVERLWRACAADLYRKTWSGRYCAGCEAFVDDGVEVCDEHGTAPERVNEDNWFFRLSRWREPVREAIASGRIAIANDAARAETLAFLAGDVRDISVSRVATRANGWGIPVPDDPEQVIFVWFDALASYLTGGWDAGERVHVIGKGITRFHAAYWPAFLLSAGLPLPDTIAVHGYLTIDGVKISKSGAGAAVPPVVAQIGADALRWHYIRCCRTRGDSDLPRGALAAAHDRDLADRLGNLVQRCVKLADDRVPPASDSPLRALAEALPAKVDAALAQFVPDEAAAAIVELLDAANRTLEATAPWQLRKRDPDAALAALYAPLECARIAAGELSPIVPGIARAIADRLGGSLDPRWGGLGAVLAGPPPVPRVAPGVHSSITS